MYKRQDESRKLQTEESSQKEEVQQLNKKQKQLQADLKKKKKQADALNRQIEKQIAEEIARAEAEAKAARERAARAERNRLAREKAAASGKKVPETKPETEPVREERVADTKGGYAMTKAEKRLSDDFASNKGRLPYPVSGRHTIVAAFGEQQHQELKYVRTNNSGIDIQTAPGTDARAVFNGEVTRVFVVPGYNNSVIVRHGNYLTVYSNLSQVLSLIHISRQPQETGTSRFLRKSNGGRTKHGQGGNHPVESYGGRPAGCNRGNKGRRLRGTGLGCRTCFCGILCHSITLYHAGFDNHGA